MTKGETNSAPPISGSTSPGNGSSAASPAPQRRLQRVEILKIAEGTPLIDPTEVVVSQGAVLTAEPVLTPLGNFSFCLLGDSSCRVAQTNLGCVCPTLL